MGTVTVTTTGFAALPATPPAGWPSYVTYLPNASTNGTKAYTLTDTDWQRLITWTAASQYTANPDGTPVHPNALQILLSWVQIWWNGTKQAEQQYGTPVPVPPPPIVIS